MAKKSRRVRSRGQGPRLSAAQLVQPGTGEAVAEADTTEERVPSARAVDLRSEYHYVVSDLRRIGLIAAGMVCVLIVLAVVLT
jgi:hypothetical protein